MDNNSCSLLVFKHFDDLIKLSLCVLNLNFGF